MAPRVVIRFPAGRTSEYYDRVFWFAESLWEPIVNAGLGTLSDIDHPPNDVVWVDVSKKRHVGAGRGILKKRLQKFLLHTDATITVE